MEKDKNQNSKGCFIAFVVLAIGGYAIYEFFSSGASLLNQLITNPSPADIVIMLSVVAILAYLFLKR